MANKDNSVASLDKIKQLYNEYENGKRTHINTLYKIGKILQNARETDKEQPNLTSDDVLFISQAFDLVSSLHQDKAKQILKKLGW